MLIGVPELISQTWHLYRIHFKIILSYITAFFVPPVLLFFAGLSGVFISRTPLLNTVTNITLLVLMALSGLFAIWNSIALTAAVGSILRGQTVLPWKQTFLTVRRSVWPIIFVGVIVGLIVFGGTILFVIPGLIFLVWYAFTYCRIVLDGFPGLGTTLRDSRELVRGRWFDIALRILIPTILFAFCSAFLRGLLSAALLFLPTSAFFDRLTINLVGTALQAAIAPLTLIAGVLLYQSAKDNPLPIPPATLNK